ncbi:MAG: transcription elongation factor GreA [Candidatus Saccharimonadales bacterium]|jgi:transcription elongation factor GreA
MNKLYRLTSAGIKELEDELASLVAKRGPIAEAIKSARELGDLAENAEYQAARQEQERTESRISEVEHILRNAEPIKETKGESKVRLGSRVTLKSAGKKKEFQVVGTVEADPLDGKISDESPLGRAVLGKKVGDEVEIVTPAETATYEIVAIS